MLTPFPATLMPSLVIVAQARAARTTYAAIAIQNFLSRSIKNSGADDRDDERRGEPLPYQACALPTEYISRLKFWS